MSVKFIKEKIIFLLLICFSFALFLNLKYSKADIISEPSFDVSVSSAPNPAKINEDITVTATIKPNPFYVEPKKQIVLVLDTSYSMRKNSRISSLKKAAQSFIKTLGENNSNVEFCIVEYSSNAIINPKSRKSDNKQIVNEIKEWEEGKKYSNCKIIYDPHYVADYDTYGERFFRYNEKDTSGNSLLKNMIECLEVNEADCEYNTNSGKGEVYDNANPKAAIGRTNAGEGLRKAAYMLVEKGDPKAEKSIVFMTDGQPTYYSVKEGTKDRNDFYTELNNIEPCYAGTGLDGGDRISRKQNVEKATEYACKIGNKIREDKYNVYSVGYGITKNSKLSYIHKSMGGKESNCLVTDNDINKVFEDIAKQISKTVSVSNMKLDFNFSDSLDIEAIESEDYHFDENKNAILSNIIYTYNDSRKQYEADPITISFKIKAKKSGVYNLNNNRGVSYEWDENTKIGAISGKDIFVSDNDVPDIKAELKSAIPNPVHPDNIITVKYNIKADQFNYYPINSNSTNIKEAIFIYDLSNTMSTGNRWPQIKDEFTNVILKGNELKDKDISFGVLGYDENVIYPDIDKQYDKLYRRTNSDDMEKLRILFQNDIMKPTEKNTRNISKALSRAVKMFEEKGSTDVYDCNRAIILINSGDVSYNQADLNAIKNKNYKIISVDMSSGNENLSLKKLHSDLNGISDNYFISKVDGNNYNFVKIDMERIANSLGVGNDSMTLCVDDAKLNFDLGGNFLVIDDSLKQNGDLYTLDIPKIKFEYGLEEGVWKLKKQYIETNGVWKEGYSTDVYFKIKPANGKYGVLGFGESANNNLSYTGFDSHSIIKSIETPLITVIPVQATEIKHGFYDDVIKDGEPQIDENTEEKILVAGTDRKLGAVFTAYKNTQTELDIGELSVTNGVKAYVIDSQGNKVSELNVSGSGRKYNISFNELTESCMKILIVYTVKVPDEKGTYTSTVSYLDKSASAYINTNGGGDYLPELF